MGEKLPWEGMGQAPSLTPIPNSMSPKEGLALGLGTPNLQGNHLGKLSP